MVADAVLLIKTCAESCDAGMANLDACVMYIMPFVVHRVTWEAWPYKQGLQERMQSNWWTQENMFASRCADEGVPIYVCSSAILRRAKDETLYVIK